MKECLFIDTSAQYAINKTYDRTEYVQDGEK